MKAGLVFAAGLMDLSMALFHLAFWRLFHWPESLASSGRVNTAITQTMNIMLTYVFIVYGACLLMAGHQASRFLLLAGAGFGIIRIILQFHLFGVRSRASLAFVLTSVMGTLLHLIPALIGG